MGGCCCCCCSSKGVELNSSPPFYHYPRVLEEHEPLSSHQATASAVSTGLLVDTNLETSIPDTYRPPPTPVPYNTNLGRPRSLPGSRESSGNKNDRTNTEPVGEINSGNTQTATQTAPVKDLKESECKLLTNIELVESEELEIDLEKSGELKKSSEPLVSALEEEDVCPTCLEEYDAENPKIITKCEHHFHLSCILEWMERSDTCPVCDQEMKFDMDG